MNSATRSHLRPGTFTPRCTCNRVSSNESDPIARSSRRSRPPCDRCLASMDCSLGRRLRTCHHSAADQRAFFARSHFAGRSGRLTVVYRPYWVDGETGTSHGTPYGYDVRVPLFLFGKGIAAGEYLARRQPNRCRPHAGVSCRNHASPIRRSRADGSDHARSPSKYTPPRCHAEPSAVFCWAAPPHPNGSAIAPVTLSEELGLRAH